MPVKGRLNLSDELKKINQKAYPDGNAGKPFHLFARREKLVVGCICVYNEKEFLSESNQ